MGKLVVSLDGVVIKEVQLTKDKTTLGRRPYNDIVIDNLAVSGEHAVLQMVGQDVFIEDLNSTNGTYINGKAIKKQLLAHNDTVEIGKYKIKYLTDEATDYEKTMVMKPGSAGAAAGGYAPSPSPLSTPSGFGGLGTSPVPAASIRVLNGAAAGREVSLTKVVTTVGKPGVQVASITKRPGGYVFAHVEGAMKPSVNGNVVGSDPVYLKNGDVIELAGTQMQFVQS
ncbi:FHA domain-containing protein [Caldimonas thermodepolymerans]|jgi:FOG: FHA domain|uniref:FHA domain-containing protein n=1 Tax=Caldimonas thermodepolymerans TaxID=215580 RepID=A0A2S5T4Z7_9BURK|nr:FHA domain-containing protein [Caldimonas thermodepolymerans]PPE70022.1 FHA domain-containing protein [Caldimonas thermodepolymerans]QPC31763.1 FHA domain-containing protein [Caldimonas thermodepolymerans]RDI01734.1 FHA domain-containing protein [Caldimonas thermodepolymerans]TCP05871.1 FHA domain-containing protein [Caldimonas thermodepolymerans]UZG44548.1 FHA domain-containing protein [Caldimonas thermodepolymerans]